MSQPNRDEQYMSLALRLAAKGRGRTSPNPMVGAVVVAGARIVGQGYHRRAGGPHAEVFALRQAGKRAAGATLYVTLEPCGHINKRTPPCVPLILESGVRRVVIAQIDPNPLVGGRGIRELKAAGLHVEVGCCCARQARRLNVVYSHWMRTGRPFVIMKAGMTLDGKIATASGESQWITGQAARRDAHRLRSQVDAVLIGIGTVLRDDPALTARVSDQPRRLAPRQPIRIVLDSRLHIPLKARVLSGLQEAHTVIATSKTAPVRKIRLLRRRGIDVLVLPERNGQVSLPALCRQLGRLRITSLLVEGGSTVNASLIRNNLPDRVVLYVAPLLLGGEDAKGLIGGLSPKHLRESVVLEGVTIRQAGHDMVIEADVHHLSTR
ncbi:MAG TPA: bifunctional diaminohydroxyphosphoribosylaminopyrimidine deaminase/5-amino-6-(5-phosphoribosylamino)uracil reductase RibD [Nitrospiraceae bacterium]|nr:bifunctional diaminohydroxyphosphoribosylaminopyrimidine deaminase/5-amino-6-(5-phosphoribosylamino)uracil reductase RibD [Nitrospiraceae bacterium]